MKSVLSVYRVGANVTTAATVDFAVAFDEEITGMAAADFSPTTTTPVNRIPNTDTVCLQRPRRRVEYHRR